MATVNDCDVWVINLERAPDRRAQMTAALDATGVPYTFLPAIDGRQLSAEHWACYDRDTRLRKFLFDLEPNEIACYLSHLHAIRTAYELGKPRVLILEDDVVPGPDFARIVDYCRALPQGHDFIRLYGARRRKGKLVQRVDETYSLIRPYNVTSTCAAYFIDRGGMQKVLDHGSRIVMQVDCMIDRYWDNGLRIFAIDPFPVATREVPSTIGRAELDPWHTAAGGKVLRLRLRARKVGDSIRKRICNVGIALGVW